MAQVKVVPDKAPDPKAGKDRLVSGFFVPYFNLDQSIEVAKVVHHAGGNVDRTQLAALLKYTGTKSGTFLTRVSAAKVFGLMDQPPQSDILRITARGVAIAAPVSESEAEKAKLDAFFDVKLFKTIYDEYKGRELPRDVGLANLFENTYKVVKNRALPSVKVMLESAETAGLFRTTGRASRKMVMPIGAASGASEKIPPTPRVEPQIERREHGGSGGGGGGGDGRGPDASRIHPAIYGLIADLPGAGQLSAAKRDALIVAFTATVKFIYPDTGAENIERT
jgi:hypothetical protein